MNSKHLEIRRAHVESRFLSRACLRNVIFLPYLRFISTDANKQAPCPDAEPLFVAGVCKCFPRTRLPLEVKKTSRNRRPSNQSPTAFSGDRENNSHPQLSSPHGIPISGLCLRSAESRMECSTREENAL